MVKQAVNKREAARRVAVVRRLVKALGGNQSATARTLGVCKASVSKWVNGATPPGIAAKFAERVLADVLTAPQNGGSNGRDGG